MTLWSVHHCPKEFLILNILFLWYRYVAFMWKNFEFLSPWTTYKDWEHWNHIFISLSSRSLTSLLSIWAWKLIPVLRATSLTWLLFVLQLLSDTPKMFATPFFKANSQSSILETIPESWLLALFFSHVALTVYAQTLLVSHISSNKNGLLGITESTGLGMISNGEWSNVLQFKWCTIDPPI